MNLDRRHIADLRGTARLLSEATAGVTDIAEQLHGTIQTLAGPLGGPRPAGAARGIAGLVYRSVRGTARLIGKGIDAGLEPLGALLPEGTSGPGRDAWVAALNGVCGDRLARSGNPFAIEMTLRRDGRPIDQEQPLAGHRLLLLLHGLCMSDRQWLRNGHDHGAALAADLGHTPLYLHYNSGLPIAENGRLFADLLEGLISRGPEPPEELVILGHSMGGLVARSACDQAREAGHTWPDRLHKLVFLGSPHHGAPLERGGHGLDRLLGVSPYSAPFARIGKVRSAGIVDLRHGNLSAAPGRFVPLPRGVTCYAAAASLAPGTAALRAQLVGDGLVPLNSALGIHHDGNHDLAIPDARRWIGYGSGHLDLLDHPGLYAQLLEWLRDNG